VRYSDERDLLLTLRARPPVHRAVLGRLLERFEAPRVQEVVALQHRDARIFVLRGRQHVLRPGEFRTFQSLQTDSNDHTCC
jgi:hypothetical protein